MNKEVALKPNGFPGYVDPIQSFEVFEGHTHDNGVARVLLRVVQAIVPSSVFLDRTIFPAFD